MKIHATDGAPAAIGPYSQAVSVDGWLYTAGQIALDPQTGQLVEGDFEDEARRVIANLRAVLESAGSGFDRVLKATIYLVDFDDFPAINELWEAALQGHRPARSTVAVSALPRGARLEIDLVARC